MYIPDKTLSAPASLGSQNPKPRRSEASQELPEELSEIESSIEEAGISCRMGLMVQGLGLGPTVS